MGYPQAGVESGGACVESGGAVDNSGCGDSMPYKVIPWSLWAQN